MMAVEQTGYRGLYFILLGHLSPIDGIGPKDLGLDLLNQQLTHSRSIQEMIIATNPTVEGEATAHYLLRLLKPLGVTVTRIATGLPVGSDLEYADELTLGKALSGRREM